MWSIFRRKKIKVGLALGGGGARGVGHIGVLKALEELGVEISFISGTSAGSVIGAFYGGGYSVEQMEAIAKNLRVKDVRDSKFIWKPSSSENIEKLIKKSFNKENVTFDDLKIPLSVVCVDMKSGKEMIFSSGDLAKIVAGSCSVPGVFKPVVYGDYHLVDGGLSNNVPADVVHNMGADVVIAVDVNSTRGQGTDSMKLVKVLSSTIGVMMKNSVDAKLDYADIVITPNLSRFSSTKIEGIIEMIKEGYDSVMNQKDLILKITKKKQKRKVRNLWQKIHKEKQALVKS